MDQNRSRNKNDKRLDLLKYRGILQSELFNLLLAEWREVEIPYIYIGYGFQGESVSTTLAGFYTVRRKSVYTGKGTLRRENPRILRSLRIAGKGKGTMSGITGSEIKRLMAISDSDEQGKMLFGIALNHADRESRNIPLFAVDGDGRPKKLMKNGLVARVPVKAEAKAIADGFDLTDEMELAEAERKEDIESESFVNTTENAGENE